jgi:hypothetical protein
MAHDRLYPKAGFPFLAPAAAIRLLQEEFAHVYADPREGQNYVRKMVEKLRQLQHFTPPPVTEEEIRGLEESANKSLHVLLADNEDFGFAYLTTCIIPGQPLFFGYSSAQHQQSAQPLLTRCCSKLGYEIEGR